jgi:dual specificity phosphatase 12
MPHPGPSTPEVQRKVVVLEDRVHVDIMQHFAECADWIREAFNPVVPTERTPLVLVHCVRGISRSATIVLAYVIREDPVQDGEGDVCERAVAWLRTRRRIAGPNSGFREQLEVWVQCEFDLFERDAAGLVMREKEMYKAHKKVLRRRYRWRDRVRDWVGVWMDRVLL